MLYRYTNTSSDMMQPIPLDPDTGVPLYQQILVILRTQITSGDLAPGDPVMGEAALCAAFNVSRITARRALNELANSGLVLRERGRGTTVAPQLPPNPMRATLDGLLENVGHIGRTTTARVLQFGYVPAGAEVAEKLGLEQGARVLHALRVRDMGPQPMSLLHTWVPDDVGALIETEDMSATPLLLLLEAAGVPVASATQTISATLADAAAASVLGVPAGAPLIDVRRVVYDTADRPVEFIKILYRPEMYQFQMSMRRIAGEDGKTWQSGKPVSPDLR